MNTKTIRTSVLDFAKEKAIWIITGLGLELGSATLSSAPSAAPLIAGLPWKKSLFALVGGAFGALLHGFPDGLMGLCAMALVTAARLIPDMGNLKLKIAIRFFSATIACFFTRCATATEPSELLHTIIAALCAGAFAACICFLTEKESDSSFPTDTTIPLSAVIALSFMSLGTLDYPIANIGRFILATATLAISALKGLPYGAVIALPALTGLCVALPESTPYAASVALGAILSHPLNRYGKITRAISFVFFGCVCTLITGADDGTWRILTETAIAGAIYAFIPFERFFNRENDFSDSTVEMLLNERLCFAADAISGIGKGLNAAAETLERKYSLTPEKIAEKAAEHACRNCPQNMVCWGKEYRLFTAEFSRLVELCRSGVQIKTSDLSVQCAALCCDTDLLVRSINKEYSRYLSASADEHRIKELRRIYSDQLEGIHDILHNMSIRSRLRSPEEYRAAEKRAEKTLRRCGMTDPSVFITSDKHGRILFEAYGDTEPKVDRDYLGEVLINAIGKDIELPEITSCDGRIRITAPERLVLSAQVGAFQLSKGNNRVCGDCYDSFTDPTGILYIILSDGMGSGSRARVDSALACSVLSKLLKSGLALSVALETVNTVLMVKSPDESFATLDICRIDLNSGECVVYKAGAATTYIKSGDRLIRATLSSPPVGTGGKLTLPAQKFSLSVGDVIIMTSDGAIIDEEWLSHELSSEHSPKELSERVARACRSHENGRDDDISVIAVAVNR